MSENITEIRHMFETWLKTILPTPTFDPRDFDKVQSDIYLNRILNHCQNNVVQAAKMLYSIMHWRKVSKINDISEDNVDLNMLSKGLFYPRGRDLNNCLLLIMNCKLFVKKQNYLDPVKKIFIYWLERLEREEGGQKITLFFDMDGEINHMNLNIITHMLCVLQKYYPNFINQIIFFQMSGKLLADLQDALKRWPKPAVEILRITYHNNLKAFVAREQALVSWGGKDKYKFEFVPEKCQRRISDSDTEDNSYCLGDMLRLHPPKFLIFENLCANISSQLSLTNMDEGIVAFKIIATNPNKYIIDPNYQILPTLNTVNVEIRLRPGYQLHSIENDRLSVLSVNIPKLDMTPTEMSQIWHTTDCNFDEYRLMCTVRVKKVTVIKIEPNAIKEITTKMAIKHNKIHHNFNLVNQYLYIIIIPIIILLVMNAAMLIQLFYED